MDPTLQKVNELLKKFNNTFEISANQVEEDGELIASGLKIDKVKNDGAEYINEMFTVFSEIVKAVSDEHELVYNEEKGLVIAKKVVQVNYVIEE